LNQTNIAPRFIGFFIQEQEFTDNLNLVFEESATYEWQIENPGLLDYVKLNGLLKGDGEVKVYLDDLLIYENSKTKSLITGEVVRETSDISWFEKLLGVITGRVAEDEPVEESDSEENEEEASQEKLSPSQEESQSSETEDTEQSVEETEQSDSEENEEVPQEEDLSPSQIEEPSSEEIINETIEEENITEETPSVNETIEEVVNETEVEENITEITNETYSEEINQTEALPEDLSPSQEELPSENITEVEEEVVEENITEVEEPVEEEIVNETTIQIKAHCIETCDISKLNLNKSSYILRIEISDAELKIKSLDYGIIKEVENITLAETNITNLTTTQYQAVLGQPVKWKKNIELKEPGKIKVKLPKSAEKITVNKITELYSEESEQEETSQEKLSPSQEKSQSSEEIVEKETPSINETEKLEDIEKQIEELEKEIKELKKQSKKDITLTSVITGEVTSEIEKEFSIKEFFKNIFSRMTGRVIETAIIEEEIEVLIDDTGTEYEIEYETPAPYAIEEDIAKGKRIKIIGPEEVHYEDVLIFTNLSETFNIRNPEKVKIYWKEENKYLPIQNIQDTDNNGIYDYVEWIAPELSNQTFEIIVITKAEHLDSNREFISDIYDEVKELDDVWSETINDSEYVRVTFEIPLDSSRDITIYPRTISGTPKIEVYEFNKTELIAEFTTINDSEYNKVYLTGLEGEQDTFDLRVLDGSVEFDYVVDPQDHGGAAWTISSNQEISGRHYNIGTFTVNDGITATVTAYDGGAETGWVSVEAEVVNVIGIINANEAGYRGGASVDQTYGEGPTGYIQDGGGQGGNGNSADPGAGGGAYGGDGGNGGVSESDSTPGGGWAGGNSYGTLTGEDIQMGAGGGGNDATGGRGGGMVNLSGTTSVTVSGTITVNGQQPGDEYAAAGGGAAGGVLLRGGSVTVSGTINANGGKGASDSSSSGSNAGGAGGGGGGGRIKVFYSGSLTNGSATTAVSGGAGGDQYGVPDVGEDGTLAWIALNSPPSDPKNITCDGSNNCNVSVNQGDIVNLTGTGSTDDDNDEITYIIEASLGGTTTTSDQEAGEQEAKAGAPSTDPTSKVCSVDGWAHGSDACGYEGTDCTGEGIAQNFHSDCVIDSCTGTSTRSTTSMMNDITLNGTVFATGDTVKVDIDVGCYSDADVAIAYNNGSGWVHTGVLDASCSGSNQEYSTTITIDNVVGTHYVRAMVCSTCDLTGSTCSVDDYSDNDDMNFTVVAGTKDNDYNETFVEYSSIGGSEFGSITNITIKTQVSYYDPTGSSSASNTRPDLEIGIYNSTDYENGNYYDVSSTMGADAANGTDTNLTVVITDSAILSAWESSDNRQIQIRGVYLDTQSGNDDAINWTGIWVSINGESWTIIGNHTNGTGITFEWNTTDIAEQNCIDLRTIAIDIDGSNSYSNYFTKNACLNITTGEADTTYPQFSSYWDDNATLEGSGTGHFNITVTNTNGTVWLEINGTNITATNYSAAPTIFNASHDFTTNDTYTYRWHSWGNGTSHNYNVSDDRNYVVNATPPESIKPIPSFGTNPIDTYNSTSQSITFELKCSDNVNPNVLQLWSNWTGTWEANQTNSTPVNDTFWNVTVNNIPEGNWGWGVYCNDFSSNENWTDTNRTFSIEIIYPQFSSYWDDNATLVGSGTGHFNVTIENTNGTVWLEINGTNITATNLTLDVYNASYDFTTNDTYTYRWHSWGNGTDENYNVSDDRNYVVNGISFGNLNVTLNTPTPDTTTDVNQNEIFWVNATINCAGDTGALCGNVTAYARYNTSSAGFPADWWNESWGARKAINITNENDTVILESGYTINFTTDTTGDKFLDNGSDVRIVYYNGTNYELDRMNKTAFNSATTEIFFKLQENISAGGWNASYYMYYNNSASGSPPTNGSNVYFFYDDFPNGDKWTAAAGSFAIDTGVGNPTPSLRMPDDAVTDQVYATDYTIPSDFVIEADVRIGSGDRGIRNIGYRHTTAHQSGYMYRLQTSASDAGFFIIDGAGAWSKIGVNIAAISADTWYHLKIQVSGSEHKAWENGVLKDTVIDATHTNTKFGSQDDGGADLLSYMDNYIVRKYLGPEPSASSGLEEEGSSAAETFKAINTSTEATPFYTTSPQPQYCVLTQGQSCQFNWSVNATGALNSKYKINVNFTSNESSVAANITNNATVNITTGEAPENNPPNNTKCLQQYNEQRRHS